MSRKRLARRQDGQALVMFAQLLFVAAIVMVFLVDAVLVFMRLSRYQANAIWLFENHIAWTPTANFGFGPGYLSLTNGEWRCPPPLSPSHIHWADLAHLGHARCFLLLDYIPPMPDVRLAEVGLSVQSHPACDGGSAIVARAIVQWAGPSVRLWRFNLTPSPIEVTRAFCALP